MLFRSGHQKKSSNPITGLFRLVMSLLIMGIMAIGLLQAYKSFSGYDPLKLDSENLKSLLTSESAYQTLISLLTFDPKDSLTGIGESVKGKGQIQNEANISDAAVVFKFAVLADSHKDIPSLERALSQAKSNGAEFVIMMGDLSDVGTLEELQATKSALDSSGLQYYVTPGDHDLWDSRDKDSDPPKNFVQVFGPAYQSFSYDMVRYILIYNSDNYLGLDGLQLKWIEDELNRPETEEASKLTFVFAPTPLYHPSSDHVMGKVTPKLTSQAEHLATLFKRAGVDLVFSADTHYYSKFTEPKNELDMLTVGAVTSERNPQAPRFALVEVLEDGNFNIVETEIQ